VENTWRKDVPVDYVPTELGIPVLHDEPVLVNGWEGFGTGLAYYHASQINTGSDFYTLFVLEAQFSLVSGLDTQTPSESVVRTWLELVASMIDWKLPKDDLYAALLEKYVNWTNIHRWISEAFLKAALCPKGKEEGNSLVDQKGETL
jgi:hypothetical protein